MSPLPLNPLQCSETTLWSAMWLYIAQTSTTSIEVHHLHTRPAGALVVHRPLPHMKLRTAHQKSRINLL